MEFNSDSYNTKNTHKHTQKKKEKKNNFRAIL